MLSSTFFVTLTVIISCVVALQHPFAAPIWSGEFLGQAFNISGTAETVIAHFRSIDPTFEVPVETLPISTIAEGSALAERDRDPNTLCCPLAGAQFKDADMSYIWQGIEYLKKLNININFAARSCGRISCSWNSAISVCNDNYNTITQGSAWLGAHANTVLNNCYGIGGGWPNTHGIVCGQNFDPGHFNVLAVGDNC